MLKNPTSQDKVRQKLKVWELLLNTNGLKPTRKQVFCCFDFNTRL